MLEVYRGTRRYRSLAHICAIRQKGKGPTRDSRMQVVRATNRTVRSPSFKDETLGTNEDALVDTVAMARS